MTAAREARRAAWDEVLFLLKRIDPGRKKQNEGGKKGGKKFKNVTHTRTDGRTDDEEDAEEEGEGKLFLRTAF